MIADLLTLEEVGSLFVHLNSNEPLQIDLKTRRAGTGPRTGPGTYSVFVSDSFSAAGYVVQEGLI